MFRPPSFGEFFPVPPFYNRAHLEKAMAPGSGIFSSNRTDRGGSASSTLLRMPLAVALMAERDTVADAVRKVRSLRNRLYMVRDVRSYVPAVPLAILTEILIPAHDRRRPITVTLLVVCRIR